MFVPKRSLILPRSLSPLSMCPWDEEALEYIDGGGGLISAPPGIVQVDHLGTAQSSGSSISTFDFTGLTISGGLTNSALIISVMQIQTGGLVNITSVTWDNGGTPQPMTQLALETAASSCSLALYGLRAPHSGNLTCRVVMAGITQVSINGISFFNVNQASDAAAFPNTNTNSGTGGDGSVTVTSAVGHIPVATFNTDNNYIGQSGTLWQTYGGGSVSFITGDGCYDVGAAPNVTLTATHLSSNPIWGAAAVDVSN
jgi:hypothetical protein